LKTYNAQPLKGHGYHCIIMQNALNPIACEPCRSKKCKCDRKLFVPILATTHPRPDSRRPTCSQCQSAQLCRYQEGGKRGLPVAYMTSLENRLQETEAALLAAVNALQGRGGVDAIDFCAADEVSKVQRSKAEKQKEWKRLPLRTVEDLVAWSVEKQQQATIAHDTTPPEHPRSDQNRNIVPSVTSKPTADVVEHLKSCRRPTIPNASYTPPTSTAWLENYF
jgi:hypothetical protein